MMIILNYMNQRYFQYFIKFLYEKLTCKSRFNFTFIKNILIYMVLIITYSLIFIEMGYN